MTKEEYKEAAWQKTLGKQDKKKLERYAEVIKFLKATFDTGFEAGCEYFRKQVLELEDNGNKE